MSKHLSRIALFLLSTLLYSCDPEPVLVERTSATPDGIHAGVYVLSEGLYNQNNSTLAWIDFEAGAPLSWQSSTGKSYDCFELANGRRIGDTANDMLLYGGKLYIAVSESSTIEIIDAASCNSLKQIKLEQEGKASQPRALTACGSYIYACCFDGTVVQIDTLAMQITATTQAGRNPDGICQARGKLYISNSGGLDFNQPDSTISVIDIESFCEIKRITVGPNPGNIYSDDAGIYVVSRGRFDYNTMNYDSYLHCIDPSIDEVTATYHIPIIDMAIYKGKAWFYGYGSGSSVQVLDLSNGALIEQDFFTDGIQIECPYSIMIDPSTQRLYITDAHDYITPGSLLCFDLQGNLIYSVQGVGINPNSVSLCHTAVTATPYSGTESDESIVSQVFAYCPAPGQFVNKLPLYEAGDDSITMAQKCLTALQHGDMITLGGFGGYITVGLRESIPNREGADLRIDGNAHIGSAEPAVVWVSADANHNGLPDDEWYELSGSEHKAGRATRGYTCTYTKPLLVTDDTPWRGSDGRTGSIMYNKYHTQSYYPEWYRGDSVIFTATLLPDNLSYENGIWTMHAFEYGYADNLPNSAANSAFDIDWAVDAKGSPVHLESIDFVKIQTAVIGCTPTTGELSTEITSINNISCP